MVEPAKKKKMPNVQFKTAWKFPETGGKSRKKAEKTGRLRKFAERVGKIRTFSNSGPKGRGKGEKRSPSGGIAEGDSDSSLLARKGERNPLQGFRATIERTVSNPSANFIVATLHRRDCSLKFDLSSDETPATGSRQSFAHFDSRKR